MSDKRVNGYHQIGGCNERSELLDTPAPFLFLIED